jgi:hypothetical protein
MQAKNCLVFELGIAVTICRRSWASRGRDNGSPSRAVVQKKAAQARRTENVW